MPYKLLRALRRLILLSLVVFIFSIVPNQTEADDMLVVPLSTENITISLQKETIQELPLRIMIPQAKIDAPITVSEMQEGTWEIDKKKANFGEGSSYLDEELGNTVLFAHARKSLFANLVNVEVGQTIVVMGEENLYTYKIESVDRVYPEDADLIRSFGETNLTIFTCDGPRSSHRVLVKAKKISKTPLEREVI